MQRIIRCPGCGRNLENIHCKCGPVRADGSLHCADKDVSVMIFAKDWQGNDLLPSAQTKTAKP